MLEITCCSFAVEDNLASLLGAARVKYLWITNRNRNIYIPAVVSALVRSSPTHYIAQCEPSTLSLPISLPVYVASTFCQLSCRLETLLDLFR